MDNDSEGEVQLKERGLLVMQKLTRQWEASLPEFYSHKEAREYFKGIFGSRFAMQRTEYIDGVKWYFYHYIIDKETYLAEMKKLANGENSDATALLASYQPIEISEEGHVHVVY